MTHPTEDALLAYALEIIETPTDLAAIDTHLAACAECGARLRRLQQEVGMIGGLRPRSHRLTGPWIRPQSARTMVLLRAAAMLAVGFGLGLWMGERATRAPVTVFPAYVTLTPPPDSLQSYPVPDGTSAEGWEPASRTGGPL